MAFLDELINFQTLLLCLCVFILTRYIMKSRKVQNLPPGPASWPLIGNLDYVAKHSSDFHKRMMMLAEKYGEIVCLFYGDTPAVILNGMDIINEVFIEEKKIFNDRFVYPLQDKVLPYPHVGIIHANGDISTRIRRVSSMALKDSGVGKKALEDRIVDESRFLIEEIEKNGNKEFDICYPLSMAVTNIIATINFGRRFDYQDKKFKELLNTFKNIIERAGPNFPDQFFPYIEKFIFKLPITKVLFKAVLDVFDYVKQEVNEHRKTFVPECPRDIIDIFQSQLTEDSKDDDIFGNDTISIAIFDLFVAGSETTGTSLRWLILYFLINPEIQKKCQEEIDKVIGPSRRPCWKDREECHYFMATLHELLRHRTIVPLSVAHGNQTEGKIRSYDIPVNSMILTNIYSVHMDPKAWPEPDRFLPERWLDGDGKFQKKDNFIPFGIGKRICLGEQLARMELFLFTTSLLQVYDFTTDMTADELKTAREGVLGVTLMPKPYLVKASRR